MIRVLEDVGQDRRQRRDHAALERARGQGDDDVAPGTGEARVDVHRRRRGHVRRDSQLEAHLSFVERQLNIAAAREVALLRGDLGALEERRHRRRRRGLAADGAAREFDAVQVDVEGRRRVQNRLDGAVRVVDAAAQAARGDLGEGDDGAAGLADEARVDVHGLRRHVVRNFEHEAHLGVVVRERDGARARRGAGAVGHLGTAEQEGHGRRGVEVGAHGTAGEGVGVGVEVVKGRILENVIDGVRRGLRAAKGRANFEDDTDGAPVGVDVQLRERLVRRQVIAHLRVIEREADGADGRLGAGVVGDLGAVEQEHGIRRHGHRRVGQLAADRAVGKLRRVHIEVEELGGDEEELARGSGDRRAARDLDLAVLDDFEDDGHPAGGARRAGVEMHRRGRHFVERHGEANFIVGLGEVEVGGARRIRATPGDVGAVERDGDLRRLGELAADGAVGAGFRVHVDVVVRRVAEDGGELAVVHGDAARARRGDGRVGQRVEERDDDGARRAGVAGVDVHARRREIQGELVAQLCASEDEAHGAARPRHAAAGHLGRGKLDRHRMVPGEAGAQTRGQHEAAEGHHIHWYADE
mmetsp:Transcript_10090/g.34913  ORF Transcript_10090/g.34913 Transcript_10090/m.34913 type:complete len:584 (+) Transcript_10090:1727-3478(+)